MGDQVALSADDAAQRGLPAIAISVERTPGLSLRPFPIANAYLAMNGPPGGPLSVFLWNCTDVPSDDVSAAITARVVPPLVPNVQLGVAERKLLMGEERDVMTFRTGVEGRWVSWIGFVVSVPNGRIFVMMGAGMGDRWSTADEVLSHPSLNNVAATLKIE